jgi:hypothetical protein
MVDFFNVNPNPCVIVNGESVPVSKVKVLDISEDFMGRDLVDFIYEGKKYRSYVILK